MIKFSLTSLTAVGATLVLLLQATPAQADKRWVASNGTANMTCNIIAPCDTFQRAHDVISSGGEINCTDAADYGQMTITKSISIICDNTHAGIMVSSGAGILINAGPSDVVTLKGLDIDGNGAGLRGIDFIAGAALHVHNVHIRNFRSNGSYVGGILFEPTAYAELYVADSYIHGNGGSGGFSGGIVISPLSSGSVNASISRIQIENNAAGVIVDGSFSNGVAVNAVVIDSMVSGSSGNGIQAFSASGKAAVSVLVDHSIVFGNFAGGINANGAAASGAGSALVRMGDSTIALNVAGVSTSGMGALQSFKNNRISGNLADGTPITAFPGPGGSALQ